VIIAASGSILIVTTAEYWIITLGTVLVGIGWSSATVASTALIADTTTPVERGRAVGTSDTFSAAAGIVLPLLGGPLAELLGLPAVGMFGAVLMLVPLALQLRLTETRPGR
jgi:MFS family permease